MENIANSEQFDLYLDRKDSNGLYKNCKGIKKKKRLKNPSRKIRKQIPPKNLFSLLKKKS